MLKLIKVTGSSLFPEYQEGDYVMIITCPFFIFKQGDTIVFQHPEHGKMIKNIERLDSDKIHVVGIHPDSIDSRRFGPIYRRSVIGKVIWQIKKPARV
jgi:phage repressor protein C with HTH and peptisase S24 domain